MSERFSQLARLERSRAIAREAAFVLEEQGCFHLKVEDVARAAGVAKGTVYLDFTSKGSLLSQTLSGACELLLAKIETRVCYLESPELRLHEAVQVLAECVVAPSELGVLLEGRLPCAARWMGGDMSPYERLEERLSEFVAECYPPPLCEPLLTAQALIAVSSTPRSRQLASERGPLALAEVLLKVVDAMNSPAPRPA